MMVGSAHPRFAKDGGRDARPTENSKLVTGGGKGEQKVRPYGNWELGTRLAGETPALRIFFEKGVALDFRFAIIHWLTVGAGS